MEKIKKVIIYSNDRDGIDLEYKKNLINNLNKKKFKIIIILTNIYDKNSSQAKRIIDSYDNNSEIIFLENLTKNILIRLIYKYLDSSNPLLIKKILKKIILYLKIFSKSEIINNFNILLNNSKYYAFLASNNQNTFFDVIEKKIFRILEKSKIPFIGTPIMGWPVNYHKKFNKFDYFITNTLSDKIKLKKKKINSIFFGCISFDLSKSLLKEKSKKKTILFLGVNSRNNFFKGIDLKKYCYELIDFFLNKNYLVYFQPHPRSPLDVSKYLNDKSFFLYKKSNKKKFKPEFCVSIMSASLLEMASRKIKTILYLPNNFILNSSSKDLDTIKNINLNTNIPYLAKYSYWAKNKSDLEYILLNKDTCFLKLIKNFDTDFKSYNSSLKLIKFIENIFNKKNIPNL